MIECILTTASEHSGRKVMIWDCVGLSKVKLADLPLTLYRVAPQETACVSGQTCQKLLFDFKL